MQRIVIRHRSGSKAQQTEEFPADTVKDLLIGRDPAAAIRFDADRDDLVGRQHARILQDPGDPFRYSLVDLNSRNGTFINRQRVTGTAAVTPGDVIQLGPGGPEFEFTLDPLPPHLAAGKTTRIAAAPPAPTRQVAAMPPTAAATATAAPEGVGKATVERMVGQAKSEGRRNLLIFAAIVVIVGAGGYGWWRTRPVPVKPMTTVDVAAAAEDSVVQIEFAWHLVFAGSGEPLYQRYEAADVDEKVWLPVFEKTEEGNVVPSLTLSKGPSERNRAIACAGGGTGFVVTSDGYIVTNRHVGANWQSYYTCFPEGKGLLRIGRGEKDRRLIDIADLPRWIPDKDGRMVSGKALAGQPIYMDVVFRNDKRRIPATLSNVSDTADVALVKVNTPQALKRLEMVDTYDSVAVGQAITIIGYPAVSPNNLIETASLDPLAREHRVTTIPDPTVTPGTIGRVFRGAVKAQANTEAYLSGMGDTYQLTATATGAGNSGGPVLDDAGHVIGIFAASRQTDARVTFAVPIRFAIELMGPGRTVK